MIFLSSRAKREHDTKDTIDGPFFRITIGTGICIIVGLGGSSVARAAQPSFDCKNASNEIEVLICSNDELSRLDRKLADTFSAANNNLSAEQRVTLAATQRGWIKGRNDCWKTTNKQECARSAYRHRIVVLEAKYGLAEIGRSTYFDCDGVKVQIIFTPVKTDPPTANVVRGDTAETLVRQLSDADGATYEGEFGIAFKVKGVEAVLEWPRGKKHTCRAAR